jgi:hypothetical protein
MKAVLGSPTRLITGLAVSTGLALLAVQPLTAAHASGTPTISASVEAGGAVVHVAGSGFGPGDLVKVVDRHEGTVVGKVFTTATRLIILPPPCASKTPCAYVLPLVGGINVNLPPHSVHCSYLPVSVRAYDMTNHTRSNVVHVTLGLGPC